MRWPGRTGPWCDHSVSFRVLTPRALREADDDTSALAWLARWFGDADELTTLRVRPMRLLP